MSWREMPTIRRLNRCYLHRPCKVRILFTSMLWCRNYFRWGPEVGDRDSRGRGKVQKRRFPCVS